MAELVKNHSSNANLQVLSAADKEYISYQISEALAEDSDFPGSIQTSAGTSIGTYTDTFYPGNLNEDPGLKTTTTTTLYQNNTTVAEVINSTNQPVVFRSNNLEVLSKTSAEFNDFVDDRLSEIMTNEYPGTFRLGDTSPGGDWRVHIANALTNTTKDFSRQYNIYKRISYTAPTKINPLKPAYSGGSVVGLEPMVNSEIKAVFGQRAKNRINVSGIGSYQLRSSAQGAPTDPGTWVARGTAVDTTNVVQYDLPYSREVTSYGQDVVYTSDTRYVGPIVTYAGDPSYLMETFNQIYFGGFSGPATYYQATFIDYAGTTYLGQLVVYAGSFGGNTYIGPEINFGRATEYAQTDYAGSVFIGPSVDYVLGNSYLSTYNVSFNQDYTDEESGVAYIGDGDITPVIDAESYDGAGYLRNTAVNYILSYGVNGPSYVSASASTTYSADTYFTGEGDGSPYIALDYTSDDGPVYIGGDYISGTALYGIGGYESLTQNYIGDYLRAAYTGIEEGDTYYTGPTSTNFTTVYSGLGKETNYSTEYTTFYVGAEFFNYTAGEYYVSDATYSGYINADDGVNYVEGAVDYIETYTSISVVYAGYIANFLNTTYDRSYLQEFAGESLFAAAYTGLTLEPYAGTNEYVGTYTQLFTTATQQNYDTEGFVGTADYTSESVAYEHLSELIYQGDPNYTAVYEDTAVYTGFISNINYIGTSSIYDGATYSSFVATQLVTNYTASFDQITYIGIADYLGGGIYQLDAENAPGALVYTTDYIEERNYGIYYSDDGYTPATGFFTGGIVYSTNYVTGAYDGALYIDPNGILGYDLVIESYIGPSGKGTTTYNASIQFTSVFAAVYDRELTFTAGPDMYVSYIDGEIDFEPGAVDYLSNILYPSYNGTSMTTIETYTLYCRVA